MVESVAEGLFKEGHEVVVISTKPIFSRFKIQDLRFKIYFIKGIYFNLGVLPKFLRLFWHLLDMFDLGSYLRVRSILKREKPVIVMTHNLKGIGYLIPLAVKLSGIKHIHTLHDIQLIHPSGLLIYGQEKKIDGLFARMYACVCRWLFSSPSIVISPSKWLLAMHEERGFFKNSKKVVLPNPASPLTSLLIRRGEKGERFQFLYVGQIEEHKGVLFLIKAFRKINAPFNKGGVGGFLGCELTIVGNGTKLDIAKKLANGADNIKFLGKKNKDEVASLMREADCLIVPSLCYENSPTVIYESFSAGLPVLASDLGGVQELLSGGAGILFRSGDKSDLRDKMMRALENRDELKNIGEAESRRVENFGLERYIDKLLLI